MKNIFLQGLLAGILSAIAGIIYFQLYQNALQTHFDKLVNLGAIAGASVFGCMLMASGAALLFRFHQQQLLGVLNVVIAVLSFASILSPISMALPLDIENPELFVGLVVPMHFFPALAYFAIAPFFSNNQREN